MATLLLSREQLSREPSDREQLSRRSFSREQAFPAPLQELFTSGKTDNATMRIAHWSRAQQARLLASLAVISRQNRGWILIANAPAPLSRRALVDAGVNPARVIEVRKASELLLQQAMVCTGIAAIVCWQPKGAALPSQGHRGQSVFIITPVGRLPTRAPIRCAASPAMMETLPDQTGVTRYRSSVTGDIGCRGMTRRQCGSMR